MDTNHIAQVLQDKKLQKHLNTKINRQFKTCRYIGDIVISEDEYILLKAYDIIHVISLEVYIWLKIRIKRVTQ